MKKFLLLITLLPTIGLAQKSLLQKQSFRATILPLGFISETRIGRNQTLVLETALAGSVRLAESKINYVVKPMVGAGIRHFYNLERRATSGRTTKSNSGNYISVNSSYQFPALIKSKETLEVNTLTAYGFSALWGMQRTYKGGFYLNLAVGYGADFDSYEWKSGLAGGFGLGFTLK